MNLKGIIGAHPSVAAVALCLTGIGVANASTITLDWVTTYPTTAGSSITGVLTLNDSAAGAVTSTSSIASANLSFNSLSFAENGLNLGPMVSTSFTITNGVLAPVDTGSAAITITPIKTLGVTTGYTAATVSTSAMGSAGLGTLITDLGALSTLLGKTNEIAGDGSFTATANLATLSFSATATGHAFLGYWQLQPTAVPLPASVWLLGAGLAGLVGVRRRSKAA